MSRVRLAEGQGCLILAATPIGDSKDASPALQNTLLGADVIAAEDTRRFNLLCERLGVHPAAKVISFFEGNEAGRTAGLVEKIQAGQKVVLVTDAGMPSVSDPGYRLVSAVIAAGEKVTAVPGPSAVLTALAVSGLPVDRFCFEGFLPRKAGERARRCAELANEPRTMVFFEAPHRLAELLAALAEALGGQRMAAICRELTKDHEEIIRGPLAELVDWATGEVRGEITLVVAGKPAGEIGEDDYASAAAQVAELVAGGMKPSAAIGQVAKRSGLKRNSLYEYVLQNRTEEN